MCKKLTQMLVLYDLAEDDIVKSYIAAQENDDSEEQCNLQYKLIHKAEEFGLSGNLFSAYLFYLLAKGENIAAQNIQHCGYAGESITKLLTYDMEIIYPLLMQKTTTSEDVFASYQPAKKCTFESYNELINAMQNADNAATAAKILLSHYKKFGSGQLACYRAFCWQKDAGLMGIEHFEKIRMNDLIGYEKQKKRLIDNTLAFLHNKPANNVLLAGARGTGKSSGVKALVNEYYQQNLRLVQITRDQIREIPVIMKCLRELAGYRFIIFLDDLSFNEGEFDYKYLKSAIEGGVASTADNVLLYATSNRRHLIKETWHDREDTQEELYRNDSVNESISLSDRFGLIINYDTPQQDEYLAIIQHYLQQAGVNLSKEQLRIEGLRWEMTHSGRSGRVAKQFVNWYLGQRLNA